MKESRSVTMWKLFDDAVALHDAEVLKLADADRLFADAATVHDANRAKLDNLRTVYAALTLEHASTESIADRRYKGIELAALSIEIGAINRARAATGAAYMEAVKNKAAIRRVVKLLDTKKRLALRTAQLNEKAETETTDHEFNQRQKRKIRKDLQAEKDAAAVRTAAIEQNAPQFGGIVCKLHPDLAGLRWTESGVCTGCAA